MKALKIPRGTLFLQLSSATLVLVAAMLYQSRSTLTASKTSIASQRATYQRYESALKLLEDNRSISATELLASFPDTELRITNGLLRESAVMHAPGALFLQLGIMLSRRASEAARAGAPHQAQLLRDACALLQWRLEQGGHAEETLTERTQRLQVAQQLQRCTERAENAIWHSS